MQTIEKIRDLDDMVFEEYKLYFPKIMNSNFAKQFPHTLNISNLLTASTNFIKNSVFDCAENDDLFGVKILFRSEIEHYLRFEYIAFNWVKSKNDDTSEKYLEFTQARELLDQLKSAVAEHKLSNPDFTVSSWKEIFDKIPSLTKYSKKEIEEETLKYTYKNIIKTLKEIDKDSEDETTFLGKLIREYANLSSFVHGGAGAHNEMLTFNDKIKRSDEYVRICGMTYQMATAVKLRTLQLLFQTDKEMFGEHCLKLDGLFKELNKITYPDKKLD